MSSFLNIAIDGPAGSGKSTVAKLLAKKLNLEYINTGAMYRAVTLLGLRNDVGSQEIDKLVELIKAHSMDFVKGELYIDGVNEHANLFKNEISLQVSYYCQPKEVRKMLVKKQQEIAAKTDIVMEGRDICTVVLPHTKNKFFVDASVDIRAKRRYLELKEKGEPADLEQLKVEIARRDKIDSEREVDPFKKAPDAIFIDTSELSIEEVVEAIASKLKA